MSDANPFSDPNQNAYQSPQYVPPATADVRFDPARLHELSARLRSFRGYCSALAVILLAWGALCAVIAIVVASTVGNSEMPSGAAYFAAALLCVNAIATLAFAVALFFRHVWAAWGVLVYTALMLVGNAINMNFNICLFVLVALFTSISITIIVQAAKLRADGVSPQAKLVRGVIAS
jgi:hypothetical protein